ncbi:hypothetical protein STAQ_27490 [Allostella sp. ATCC 35155]|nr:hypothetical protein STAQ_27490 [Stella sp. ATCC 35155]
MAVEIREVEKKHPPALLTCEDEPAVPPRPWIGSTGTDWIARMRAAGQDCRYALRCIRERQAGRACGR